MKISNLLYLFFCVALLASCKTEYDVDENFDLQELPGYVAFDAPGTSVNLADVQTDEEAGSTSIKIECPTGTLSDVTIQYDLSGDAVMGTDYNIAGASGSSGTITLTVDPEDFQNNDNVDLVVELLEDGVVDGVKTLTITLVSASNAEGAIAVGRGGTDYLKTINVIIADADCESLLAGTFDATSTAVGIAAGIGWDDCDGDMWTGTVRWEKQGLADYIWYSSDANNAEAVDYSMGAYYACYGDGAGLPTIPGSGDLLVTDICNTLSWSGSSQWGEVYTFTEVTPNGTELTIAWSNDYGEAGSTVLVRQDGNEWPSDLTF